MIQSLRSLAVCLEDPDLILISTWHLTMMSNTIPGDLLPSLAY